MKLKSLISKYRLYISPLFLARYYILRSVEETVNKYKFRGTVLDVGCGDKPYKYLFKYGTDYKGIDFKLHSTTNCFPYSESPDYYFPKDYAKTFRLPFQNEQFNHVVAFQVLEHHRDPEKMFTEIFRVVKPGGFVLITVPFIGGIHGEPDDYQRFTKYGLMVRAKKYGEIVTIQEQGSVASVISSFFGEALVRFTGRSRFHYILGVMIFPPFLIYSYLSFILDKIFPSNHIFLNYLLLVRKY